MDQQCICTSCRIVHAFKSGGGGASLGQSGLGRGYGRGQDSRVGIVVGGLIRKVTTGSAQM